MIACKLRTAQVAPGFQDDQRHCAPRVSERKSPAQSCAGLWFRYAV